MASDPFVLALCAEPWLSLSRYRERRSQDVFSLLIERYVNRALRDNPARPH